MINESLLTVSQETTESVTINDKTISQPSTETPLSTANTAAPISTHEEVKQKNQHRKKIYYWAFTGNEILDNSHKVTARRLQQERQR